MNGLVAVALLALAAPLGRALQAQTAPVPPRSAYARAAAVGDTVVRIGNAALVAPPGSVRPGAVVGFGVGGVPYGDSGGWIVTAAGGLSGPVTIVAPTTATGAAVRHVASGALYGCLAAPGRLACTVDAVGAYEVTAADLMATPPAPDSVQRALRSAGAPPAPARSAAAAHTAIAAAGIVAVILSWERARAWLDGDAADDPPRDTSASAR